MCKTVLPLKVLVDVYVGQILGQNETYFFIFSAPLLFQNHSRAIGLKVSD